MILATNYINKVQVIITRICITDKIYTYDTIRNFTQNTLQTYIFIHFM